MAETQATGWDHFPHEGDVGVRGHGDTLAEAFENAARALTSIIVPLDLVEQREVVTVTCEGSDPDYLLLDWLNAVIFEMATRGALFSGFTVEITGNGLRGEMRGEPVDVTRHEPSVEPKGATLTELRVAQGVDGRWVAQCVVDV
ncbi:archease [Ostreiculturibacter nitratireducens]|uniref:archease n=1 Tax=Ostreiculturibacter nitratireducens TaxID=3075226 RepID=UPI0031B5B30A